MTVHVFFELLAIAVALGCINILADVTCDYINHEQDARLLSKLFGDETVEPEELIGPAHDKMTLTEFYDFWMLLTDEQKDEYIGYSWDDQPFVQ
jgi:hypothetical protein